MKKKDKSKNRNKEGGEMEMKNGKEGTQDTSLGNRKKKKLG